MRPQATLGLDPSLSGQLLYLYLYHLAQERFGGDVSRIWDLAKASGGGAGRGRSLQVASVDVATSASSLTSVGYDIDDGGVIHPRLRAAERLPTSGRELRDVIVDGVVLPAIADALAAGGYPNPQGMIDTIAGTSGQDPAGDPHAGIRLLQKIVRPAADALLAIYRSLPTGIGEARSMHFTLARLVEAGGGRLEPSADRFQATVRSHGALAFDLGAVPVILRPRVIAPLMAEKLAPLVDSIADVTRRFGLDLLILSGPHSSLPDLRQLLLRKLLLAPHRIVDIEQGCGDLRDRLASAGAGGGINRLAAAVGASLAGRSGLDHPGFNLLASELDLLATGGPSTSGALAAASPAGTLDASERASGRLDLPRASSGSASGATEGDRPEPRNQSQRPA